MAEGVFSRTWPSGKTVWYTKLKDGSGQHRPVKLPGIEGDGDKQRRKAEKVAAELRQRQARFLAGLDTGTVFEGTFAELCAWAYEQHFCNLRGARPEQVRLRTHAGDPEAGAVTWLGELPAQAVDSATLERYFGEIAKTLTVRGTPTSPNTINRLRSTFSSVFAVATRHGLWVGDDPAEQTAARAVTKAVHDILAPHEVMPTLDATPEYWRGCLATGILALLRKGELFALLKRDVNLAGRVLYVQRSHEHDATKGGERAAVPIHEALVPYLEPWLRTPGPYLFPDKRGGRRSRDVNLPKILRAAVARAGFVDHYEHACRRKTCPLRDPSRKSKGKGYVARHPDGEQRRCPECNAKLWATARARKIKWHEATRHTGASHALMSGASLQGVQAILRHKDPRLTTNTYGHLNAGFLAAEVNRIALPGMTMPAAADTVQTLPKPSETSEPRSPSRTVVGDRLGAQVVREQPLTIPATPHRSPNQHQNSLEPEWRRGGLNPGPMHCESNVAAFAGFADSRQVSQTPANPSVTAPADSKRSLPLGTARGEFGAPLVHEGGKVPCNASTPQAAKSTAHLRHTLAAAPLGRNGGPVCAGPAEPMLTVSEVARRLGLSRDWVYNRIESGDLPSRREPTGRFLVSANGLDAYLAQFPGIQPPAAPAPAAEPVAERKGVA